jgi:hypothetical protein
MIFCPRLLRLRSTGILNRISKRAWPIKVHEDKTLWTSVSIDAVRPIFLILTIGAVLATVLMFIERQVSDMVKRSSKRYRTSDRREPEIIRIGSL